MIECCVTGLPAGIGDPVFDKLDARLASAIMSIGAVKAVEIGDGIEVSSRKGSENNDAFCIKDGQVSKKTNHAGGILGGISDGSPVLLRAHIKPTPSIFQPQQTIGRDHVERMLQIKGRHDPVIVPRAVVVVESMTALTILDLMLSNMGARMDHLEKSIRNKHFCFLWQKLCTSCNANDFLSYQHTFQGAPIKIPHRPLPMGNFLILFFFQSVENNAVRLIHLDLRPVHNDQSGIRVHCKNVIVFDS